MKSEISKYAEWSNNISLAKNIMLKCRTKANPAELVEAKYCLKKAAEISFHFPPNDLRRFMTLSLSIAFFCHLGCYAYIEFDRQMLLRMARRYQRPIFGDVLNSLGMLYQEHGKIGEAGEFYRLAVKLLPPNHVRFDLLISNLKSLINEATLYSSDK